MIEGKFRQHRLADIIASMPGFGSLLSAELLAATNGDLTSFSRYDRRLLRVFYLAANNSIKTCPESRNYHDRKRSEGKLHSQAVLCLARPRLNVLWAMQQDNTSYQPGSPRAA